jgi:drug/metabolite transporter (DMT)-like permease
MGIAFGLLAALGWGIYDYLATCLSRGIGTTRALVYAQSASLLAWIILACLPIWGEENVVKWSGLHEFEGGVPVWVWLVGAGLCHVLGLVLSYRAFEIGTLALVSPLASSFAIVTALLSISTREKLPSYILFGAGLLFAGIVLATRVPAHEDESNKGLRGVPEALACAVGFGTMFWMMKPLDIHLGQVAPLIVLKIMATGLSLVGLAVALKSYSLPAEDAPLAEDAPPAENESLAESAPPATSWENIALVAAGMAGVDCLAWVGFINGDRLGYTTVVTALASLFSVVTILMAWLILKERLAKVQWVGIAIILLGVLIVSLPEKLFSR